MKFKVYLKDPDGFYDYVKDAVASDLPEGLDDDEEKSLIESRMEKVNESISAWVEYSECVTIEFDTDAGTATVLPK